MRTPRRTAKARTSSRAGSRHKQESRISISTKLFVGNLDFNTTSDELRTLLQEAGEVVSVTLPTDRDTGRPRGFAFVEMATSELASAVMSKFNGFALNGRNLRIDEATERPARPMGGGFGAAAPGPPRSRPKGSRRNLRARKRGF